MDFKDYYQILGVARDASPDEIQRAYRKLARTYHPDVNQSPGAEDRFKEIGEAYEVLKDPEKRKRYDQFGQAWKHSQRSGGPPPGFENIEFDFGRGGQGPFDFGGGSGFSSFFESLFGRGGAPGGGGGPGGGFGGGGGTWVRRGADHEATIALTLGEAAMGGEKQVALADPRSGGRRSYTVRIPKGIRPGQKIRLAGQGSEGTGGGPAGDLFLRVEVTPHATLRLQGSDLVTEVPISPWEAALGGTASLETLDGPVTIRIPPGSSSGRRIRLRGRGFPSPAGRSGDLFVELRIVIPDDLTTEERRLFQELARASRFEPRGSA